MKLGALVPLPRTPLSPEPVPGVRAILFFYSSSIFAVPPPAPLPRLPPPGRLQTLNQQPARVLLTGDFLSLRAPWWDQGPSWSLGAWGEGRKGWGEQCVERMR